MEFACRQSSAGETPQCRSLVPGRAADYRRSFGISGKKRAELLRLIFELLGDAEKIEPGIERGRKQQREALADGQRVLRPPSFGPMAQQAELPGQFLAALVDVAVDTGAIGVQARAQLL